MDEEMGNARPMAANDSRKSRREMRRFMQSFAGSGTANARLAEAKRGRMARAKLMGVASTAVIMVFRFGAESNERDSNCQSRVHKRVAEDVRWKSAERKVDAGGRHPPSLHSRARTETSTRTESTAGC